MAEPFNDRAIPASERYRDPEPIMERERTRPDIRVGDVVRIEVSGKPCQYRVDHIWRNGELADTTDVATKGKVVWNMDALRTESWVVHRMATMPAENTGSALLSDGLGLVMMTEKRRNDLQKLSLCNRAPDDRVERCQEDTQRDPGDETDD